MELTPRFREIVRRVLGLEDGAIPAIDRLALYRCQVVSCAADGSTVDLQPDDKRIPAHQTVPLRAGVAGSTTVVQSGAIVLLGWEGGNPAKPYAATWESAGVTKFVLNGDAIHLAGETLSDKVATKRDLQVLYRAIALAVPVPNDGGAALQTGITAALVAAGWSPSLPDGNFCSSKVKAQR